MMDVRCGSFVSSLDTLWKSGVVRTVTLGLLLLSASIHPLIAQTTSPAQTVSGDSDVMAPEASKYPGAKQGWDLLFEYGKAHGQIPKEMADAFVQPTLGNVPDPAMAEPVCSAEFVRLSGGDAPALVASLDVNGREYCKFFAVITRTDTAVMIQGVDGWLADDVHDLLLDLKKDGQTELVVPMEASDYNGLTNCMATWTRIFTMANGKLVDRSADFKDYYRERLDEIIKALPSAKADDQSDGTDGAVCLQIEADQIRRFLGIDKEAGKEIALQWVNSSNESLRLKGIIVLGNIGDKESKAMLQKLTQDGDSIVVMQAKESLGLPITGP